MVMPVTSVVVLAAIQTQLTTALMACFVLKEMDFAKEMSATIQMSPLVSLEATLPTMSCVEKDLMHVELEAVSQYAVTNANL